MLSAEELMLLNCGTGEESSEFLGQQGIKRINPKGNQQSLEGLEAEASVLCPLDVKSQLAGKGPEAGKD